MKKLYSLLSILALPSVLLLYSYNSGSPGGKSGSMGDGGSTCTDCHTGTAQSQTGWITTNIPAEGYNAGETYIITATGTHTGVVKFGFELTAEDQTGVKVGTFGISEPLRTKFANAEKAVTHTSGGTTPTGTTNSWTMEWTVPMSAPAAVRFNAAFNAANGNGNTGGDIIYTSSASANLYVPAPEITGVDPNHAPQGFNGTLEISGMNTTWISGVSEVGFVFHDNNSVFFEADQVTVLNDELVTVEVSVPIDIEIGNYNVYVDDVMLLNGFVVDIYDAIEYNYLVDAVSVYPNPAVDKVVIEAPANSQIVIADVSGRIVGKHEVIGTSVNINVSSYNSGLYFVQVTHNGTTFSKKLLKK